MTEDEREVARLLAGGAGEDEVRALYPGVDSTRRDIVELADWYRQSAGGSDRLTTNYLEVRIMSLVDDESHKCEHCGRGGRLEAKDRARLLTTLARLRGKGR